MQGKRIGRLIMEYEAENIELLERAILNEARAETEQIHAEAGAKADEIRKRAQEQADRERREILERASQDVERLRGQAVATAQLKARTLQLEHREKLLDQVFKAVREKFPSLRKRPDYEQIVTGLLREAVIQLKANKAEVQADEITQKMLKPAYLNKISEELKVELTIGAPLEEGTGLVVNASDGHLHYDDTFEARLGRMQGNLRSAVYQVLMGEKL